MLAHGSINAKRRPSKKGRRNSRCSCDGDSVTELPVTLVLKQQESDKLSRETVSALARVLHVGQSELTDVLESLSHQKGRTQGDGSSEDDDVLVDQLLSTLRSQQVHFLQDLSLAMLQQQQQYLSQLSSTLEMQQVQFLHQLRSRVNHTQSAGSQAVFSPCRETPTRLIGPPQSPAVHHDRGALRTHSRDALSASRASLFDYHPSVRDRCPPPPNTPLMERRALDEDLDELDW